MPSETFEPKELRGQFPRGKICLLGHSLTFERKAMRKAGAKRGIKQRLPGRAGCRRVVVVMEVQQHSSLSREDPPEHPHRPFCPHRHPPPQRPRRRLKVRLMLPVSMRCSTCGNCLVKGTRLNSWKEDVATFHAVPRSFRCSFKCSHCAAGLALTFHPPSNHFVADAGASIL